MLLADCAADAARCELIHGLPWYFGLALFTLWAGAVVGIGILAARRRATRRARRRTTPPAIARDADRVHGEVGPGV